MRSTKLQMASLVVATLGIAALLGGPLGVVAAGQKASLSSGANPTVGGPLGGDVQPDKWVSCLPASSWRAVYLWDGTNQEWNHYFNTTTEGVPAWVNDTDVGGIDVIPRLSGVYMLMAQAVANPYLPDSSSDSCP